MTPITVERPDVDAAAREAAREIEEQLTAIASSGERIRSAKRIEADAKASVELLTAERDRLVTSLSVYGRVPDLAKAIAAHPRKLTELRLQALGETVLSPSEAEHIAREHGVEEIPAQDAARRLPALVLSIAAAQARIRAARQVLRQQSQHRVTIERRDFTEIRRKQTEEVETALGRIADPVQRFYAALGIFRDAQEILDRDMPERDALALSLSFYARARGIEKTLGLSRNAWHYLRTKTLGLPKDAKHTADEAEKLARELHIPEIPAAEAERRLPALAESVAVAKARQDAARPYRNATVRVLLGEPYNWSMAKLAEELGMHPEGLRTVRRKS
jgi:hypothetical protein